MLAIYINLYIQKIRGCYFQTVIPSFIKDVKDAILAYRLFVLLYHVTNVWNSTLTEINKLMILKA